MQLGPLHSRPSYPPRARSMGRSSKRTAAPARTKIEFSFDEGSGAQTITLDFNKQHRIEWKEEIKGLVDGKTVSIPSACANLYQYPKVLEKREGSQGDTGLRKDFLVGRKLDKKQTQLLERVVLAMFASCTDKGQPQQADSSPSADSEGPNKPLRANASASDCTTVNSSASHPQRNSFRDRSGASPLHALLLADSDEAVALALQAVPRHPWPKAVRSRSEPRPEPDARALWHLVAPRPPFHPQYATLWARLPSPFC